MTGTQDPERRRIRDVATQRVLAAFQSFAGNSCKITDFLSKRATGEKKLHKLPGRWKASSLTTWIPTSGRPGEEPTSLPNLQAAPCEEGFVDATRQFCRYPGVG